jgi:hypothetical protein
MLEQLTYPPSSDVRFILEKIKECELCGRSEYNGVFHKIDHCHRTGIIRGRICHSCNMRLGQVENNGRVYDQDWMTKALDWIAKTKDYPSRIQKDKKEEIWTYTPSSREAYKHVCHNCNHSWPSFNPHPTRCALCNVKNWKRSQEMAIVEFPQESASDPVDLGQGLESKPESITCVICDSSHNLFRDPYHNQSLICITCVVHVNIMEACDTKRMWRLTSYMKERISHS